MRNNYLLFVGIILCIIFVILVVLSFISRGGRIGRNQTTPTPFPTSSLTDGKRQASLLSTLPAENIATQYFPIQQVGFAFSYPVSPDDVYVTVTPTNAFKVFAKPEDPSTLIVSPDPIWKPGIITITLTMKQNFTHPYFFTGTIRYQLNTDSPKNPPAGTDY